MPPLAPPLQAEQPRPSPQPAVGFVAHGGASRATRAHPSPIAAPAPPRRFRLSGQHTARPATSAAEAERLGAGESRQTGLLGARRALLTRAEAALAIGQAGNKHEDDETTRKKHA